MTTRSRTEQGSTAQQILDVAERLVQRQGFNGFSYADIAAEMELTKPALHYHFSSKAELGEALIVRYSDRFAEALAALDSGVLRAPAKLEGYAALYAEVLRNRRMCLCGMLAAEYQTLPPPMRRAVIEFFNRNEVWLARVLDEGRSEGDLTFDGPAGEEAQMIVGTLEGAMLVARPHDDVARFEMVAHRLVHELVVRSDRTAGA
jgi:TetR/AcrR family transcriptional regulator, transcriptional repressor for nem operon